MKSFYLISVLAVVACSAPKVSSQSHVKEAWNDENNPVHMSDAYNAVLAELPLTATLNQVPWSDTYWPSNEGGIAARWITAGEPANGFKYSPPSEAEVRAMNDNSIALLSPAEKYDIFMERFDYPTVNSERARVSPTNASWEGLCHGWALAAYKFLEPKPVRVFSASGIGINFGSSDVKALLTYKSADASNGQRFLASRCNTDLEKNPEAANSIECRDTNAGSFHTVLANQIGLKGEAFIADVVRDQQVWNHPIYSYQSQKLSDAPPSPGAAAGTVSEAVMHTSMTYAVESSAQWNDSVYLNGTAEYDYRLELDASGKIIGGEWISDARPDFLWTQDTPVFSDYYSGIQRIYDAARL